MLARVQAVRRAIDYMLAELEALGITEAAHLMDAAGAAIDDWMVAESGQHS